MLGDNHGAAVVVPDDNHDAAVAVVQDDNDVLAVVVVQDDGVCPLCAKSYLESVAMHSIAASALNYYQITPHQFQQR